MKIGTRPFAVVCRLLRSQMYSVLHIITYKPVSNCRRQSQSRDFKFYPKSDSVGRFFLIIPKRRG